MNFFGIQKWIGWGFLVFMICIIGYLVLTHGKDNPQSCPTAPVANGNCATDAEKCQGCPWNQKPR